MSLTEKEAEELAEAVSKDLIEAVNGWLVPELEKVLGKKIVIGIGEQDFDSVLQAQCAGLWLKKSHTIKNGACYYYFRLMKRDMSNGKDKVLSKFQWIFLEENY